MRIWNKFSRYSAKLSRSGLLLAALFFAASLTPSLVPRPFVVQGVLSGFLLATGYGLGVCASWLWRYVELPFPGARLRHFVNPILAIVVLLVAGFFLWRATIWQNSIRELMEMPPTESAQPLWVGLIAAIVAAFVLSGARFLGRSAGSVTNRLDRIVPRRISVVLGFLFVGLLLLTFVDGVLAKNALRLADSFFSELDSKSEDGVLKPTNSLATGSADSLVRWDTIGRLGRTFIATGATKQNLRKFAGENVQQPLRVYVGLRSSDTMQGRAKLALEELKRVGAFDRSVLVIATPTGTGWLDPAGVDPLEYIHAGDTAIVAMQYSNLPSWLTLLVDPDRSRDAARALFDEVYGYWATLPKDNRPKLYLHGLSLGALGSEASTSLIFILEDMIQGAVWSGPPFPSRVWADITRKRNPESPFWLPRFRDGSAVRFTGRENALDLPGARWGPLRIAYIQHASDPMSFFSPDILFRRPDWLAGKRGPDVSPYFTWYPIISFLQIAFDLTIATTVPIGYGHNFSTQSYIDAWVEVTDPKGWSNSDTDRLKRAFAACGILPSPKYRCRP